MIKFIHTRNVDATFVEVQLSGLGVKIESMGASTVNGECLRVFQIDHPTDESLLIISLSIPCQIRNSPQVRHEKTV